LSPGSPLPVRCHELGERGLPHVAEAVRVVREVVARVDVTAVLPARRRRRTSPRRRRARSGPGLERHVERLHEHVPDVLADLSRRREIFMKQGPNMLIVVSSPCSEIAP
jgi:hypothetical protein